MARSDFIEKQFTCSICGERFKVLTGNQPVIDPVCMHCGLRYSNEKRQRLIREAKERRGR